MSEFLLRSLVAAFLAVIAGTFLIWFYFGQIDHRNEAAETKMRTAIEQLQHRQRQEFIRQHEQLNVPVPTPRQIPLPVRP